MRDKSVQSEYISIREAGSILGVTDQAIYLWLEEGRIEHLKIKAKIRTKWRISRADFNRFVQESTIKAKPKARPGRPTTIHMERQA
jgi:excisionase family DNA binding protein